MAGWDWKVWPLSRETNHLRLAYSWPSNRTLNRLWLHWIRLLAIAYGVTYLYHRITYGPFAYCIALRGYAITVKSVTEEWLYIKSSTSTVLHLAVIRSNRRIAYHRIPYGRIAYGTIESLTIEPSNWLPLNCRITYHRIVKSLTIESLMVE